MHVERQVKLPLPTVTEIKATEATYAHECEFCGRRCKTATGLKIHKAVCNRQHGLTNEEFEVKDIKELPIVDGIEWRGAVTQDKTRGSQNGLYNGKDVVRQYEIIGCAAERTQLRSLFQTQTGYVAAINVGKATGVRAH